MITTESITEIQQRLQHVQARVAMLTTELQQAEGERDRLLLRLTDSEGAHDRRPVAVR